MKNEILNFFFYLNKTNVESRRLSCASTVAAFGDFLYCSVTLRKTSSNETSCKP